MSRVTCTIDLSDSNSEAHNVVDELDLTESCQPDVSCEMQSDVTISSDSNMSNETVVDNEQNMSNETVVDNEQYMSNETVVDNEQNMSNISTEYEEVTVQEKHKLAYGSIGNNFLSLDAIMNLFENHDQTKIVQTIPQGLKENVFFLANNDSKISDDCGVWNSASGASPKTSYLK